MTAEYTNEDFEKLSHYLQKAQDKLKDFGSYIDEVENAFDDLKRAVDTLANRR